MSKAEAATKEELLGQLESDQEVIFYNLELGDYLLRVLSSSTCAPSIYRHFQVKWYNGFILLLLLLLLLKPSHQNVLGARPAPILVAPWLPILIRPSAAALLKVSHIWSNVHSAQHVDVVLVQLREGGHTHSYNLLNRTGEEMLYKCALDVPLHLNSPCNRVAYFIAADKVTSPTTVFLFNQSNTCPPSKLAASALLSAFRSTTAAAFCILTALSYAQAMI